MDFSEYHRGFFGISSWIFRVIILDNSGFTIGFLGLSLWISQVIEIKSLSNLQEINSRVKS